MTDVKYDLMMKKLREKYQSKGATETEADTNASQEVAQEESQNTLNGWQKFGAGLEEFGSEMAQTFLDLGEGLVDAHAFVVGSIAEASGNNSLADSTKKFIQRDWSDELVNQGKLFGADFDLWRYMNFPSEALFGSKTRDYVRENDVLPDVVDSVASGIGSSVGMGLLTAIPYAGWALTGMAAGGASAEQTLNENENVSMTDAMHYGFLSGATEVATELFVGKALGALGKGINKATGKSVVTSTGKSFAMGKTTGGNILTNLIEEFGEEGTEEAVSDLVDPISRKLTIDKDKSWEDTAKEYTTGEFWNGVWTSFWEGGLSAVVMGGTADAIGVARTGSVKGYNAALQVEAVAEVNQQITELEEKNTGGRYDAKIEALTAQKENIIKNFEAKFQEYAKEYAEAQKAAKAQQNVSEALSDFASNPTVENGKAVNTAMENSKNDINAMDKYSGIKKSWQMANGEILNEMENQKNYNAREEIAKNTAKEIGLNTTVKTIESYNEKGELDKNGEYTRVFDKKNNTWHYQKILGSKTSKKNNYIMFQGNMLSQKDWVKTIVHEYGHILNRNGGNLINTILKSMDKADYESMRESALKDYEIELKNGEISESKGKELDARIDEEIAVEYLGGIFDNILEFKRAIKGEKPSLLNRLKENIEDLYNHTKKVKKPANYYDIINELQSSIELANKNAKDTSEKENYRLNKEVKYAEESKEDREETGESGRYSNGLREEERNNIQASNGRGKTGVAKRTNSKSRKTQKLKNAYNDYILSKDQSYWENFIELEVPGMPHGNFESFDHISYCDYSLRNILYYSGFWEGLRVNEQGDFNNVKKNCYDIMDYCEISKSICKSVVNLMNDENYESYGINNIFDLIDYINDNYGFCCALQYIGKPKGETDETFVFHAFGFTPILIDGYSELNLYDTIFDNIYDYFKECSEKLEKIIELMDLLSVDKINSIEEYKYALLKYKYGVEKNDINYIKKYHSKNYNDDISDVFNLLSYYHVFEPLGGCNPNYLEFDRSYLPKAVLDLINHNDAIGIKTYVMPIDAKELGTLAFRTTTWTGSKNESIIAFYSHSFLNGMEDAKRTLFHERLHYFKNSQKSYAWNFFYTIKKLFKFANPSKSNTITSFELDAFSLRISDYLRTKSYFTVNDFIDLTQTLYSRVEERWSEYKKYDYYTQNTDRLFDAYIEEICAELAGDSDWDVASFQMIKEVPEVKEAVEKYRNAVIDEYEDDGYFRRNTENTGSPDSFEKNADEEDIKKQTKTVPISNFITINKYVENNKTDDYGQIIKDENGNVVKEKHINKAYNELNASIIKDILARIQRNKEKISLNDANEILKSFAVVKEDIDNPIYKYADGTYNLPKYRHDQLENVVRLSNGKLMFGKDNMVVTVMPELYKNKLVKAIDDKLSKNILDADKKQLNQLKEFLKGEVATSDYDFYMKSVNDIKEVTENGKESKESERTATADNGNGRVSGNEPGVGTSSLNDTGTNSGNDDGAETGVGDTTVLDVGRRRDILRSNDIYRKFDGTVVPTVEDRVALGREIKKLKLYKSISLNNSNGSENYYVIDDEILPKFLIDERAEFKKAGIDVYYSITSDTSYTADIIKSRRNGFYNPKFNFICVNFDNPGINSIIHEFIHYIGEKGNSNSYRKLFTSIFNDYFSKNEHKAEFDEMEKEIHSIYDKKYVNYDSKTKARLINEEIVNRIIQGSYLLEDRKYQNTLLISFLSDIKNEYGIDYLKFMTSPFVSEISNDTYKKQIKSINNGEYIFIPVPDPEIVEEKIEKRYFKGLLTYIEELGYTLTNYQSDKKIDTYKVITGFYDDFKNAKTIYERKLAFDKYYSAYQSFVAYTFDLKQFHKVIAKKYPDFEKEISKEYEKLKTVKKAADAALKEIRNFSSEKISAFSRENESEQRKATLNDIENSYNSLRKDIEHLKRIISSNYYKKQLATFAEKVEAEYKRAKNNAMYDQKIFSQLNWESEKLFNDYTDEINRESSSSTITQEERNIRLRKGDATYDIDGEKIRVKQIKEDLKSLNDSLTKAYSKISKNNTFSNYISRQKAIYNPVSTYDDGSPRFNEKGEVITKNGSVIVKLTANQKINLYRKLLDVLTEIQSLMNDYTSEKARLIGNDILRKEAMSEIDSEFDRIYKKVGDQFSTSYEDLFGIKNLLHYELQDLTEFKEVEKEFKNSLSESEKVTIKRVEVQVEDTIDGIKKDAAHAELDIQENAALIEELKKSKELNAEDEKMISDLKNENEKLKADVQTEKDKASKLEEYWDEKYKALVNLYKEGKIQLKEIEKTFKSLRKDYEKVISDSEKENTKVKTLSEKVKELQSKYSEVVNKMKESTKRNSELKEKVKELRSKNIESTKLGDYIQHMRAKYGADSKSWFKTTNDTIQFFNGMLKAVLQDIGVEGIQIGNDVYKNIFKDNNLYDTKSHSISKAIEEVAYHFNNGDFETAAKLFLDYASTSTFVYKNEFGITEHVSLADAIDLTTGKNVSKEILAYDTADIQESLATFFEYMAKNNGFVPTQYGNFMLRLANLKEDYKIARQAHAQYVEQIQAKTGIDSFNKLVSDAKSATHPRLNGVDDVFKDALLKLNESIKNVSMESINDGTVRNAIIEFWDTIKTQKNAQGNLEFNGVEMDSDVYKMIDDYVNDLRNWDKSYKEYVNEINQYNLNKEDTDETANDGWNIDQAEAKVYKEFFRKIKKFSDDVMHDRVFHIGDISITGTRFTERITEEITDYMNMIGKAYWNILSSYISPRNLFLLIGAGDENSMAMQLYKELEKGTIRTMEAKMALSKPVEDFFNGEGKKIAKEVQNDNPKYNRKIKYYGGEITASTSALIDLYESLKEDNAYAHIHDFGIEFGDLKIIKFSTQKERDTMEIMFDEKKSKIAEITNDFTNKKITREQEAELKQQVYDDWNKTVDDFYSLVDKRIDEVKAGIEKELDLKNEDSAYAKYVKLLDDMYELAKKYKIDADSRSRGFTNAQEGFYYPNSVSDFNLTFDPAVDSHNMANTYGGANLGFAGQRKFNMSRTAAKGALRLGNSYTKMTSHINGMSLYYGIDTAISTFSQLYKYRVKGGMSAGNMMRMLFGTNYKKFDNYIGTLFKDMRQTNYQSTGTDAAFQNIEKALRSGVVTATLVNPKVIMTQPASIFAAMRYIKPKYFLGTLHYGIYKLFGKNIPSLPTVAAYRYYDSSALEAETGGLSGALAKTDKTIGKGITAGDHFAIQIEWVAALKQASDELGISNIRDARVVERATKTMNTVCLYTQPSNVAISKSEILRSKNEIVKLLTMYKSQASQNFNMFYGAVQKIIIMKKTKNLAGLGEAKKELASSLISLLFEGLCYTLIGTIWSHIVDRDWGKEDFWKESVKDFAVDFFNDNVLGMMPIVDKLKIDLDSKFKVSVDNISMGWAENLIDSVQNLLDSPSPKRFLTLFSYGTGIPISTNYKYFKGILQYFAPEFIYEVDSLYNGTDTTSKTSLNEAITEGQKTKAKYLYKQYTNNSMELSDATLDEMFSLYEAGDHDVAVRQIPDTISYDGTTYAVDKKQFKNLYSMVAKKLDKLVSTTAYKNLSSEKKSKVIQYLTNVFYSIAKKNVTGQELTYVEYLLANGYNLTSKQIIQLYTLNSMESDEKMTKKEKITKYINKLDTLKGEKYFLYMLSGYSVDDENKKYIKTYLINNGMTFKEAKAYLGL